MYHLVVSTNEDYHVHLVKKVSKLFLWRLCYQIAFLKAYIVRGSKFSCRISDKILLVCTFFCHANI